MLTLKMRETLTIRDCSAISIIYRLETFDNIKQRRPIKLTEYSICSKLL